MNPNAQIIKYLDETRVMQVATSSGDRPWSCTVFFAVDNAHHLYWLSLPDREHSQDISRNPYVGGSISVTQEYGKPVCGIQFRGSAREVTDPQEITSLSVAYGDRFHLPTLAEDIISGKNPQHLYQMKPELYVLYDEANSPSNPRQEWWIG